MNLWRCQEAGCKHSAVGVGGAVGLRAIGWYFVIGEPLKCPVHHPAKSGPVRFYGCTLLECGLCNAAKQAYALQTVLTPLPIEHA